MRCYLLKSKLKTYLFLLLTSASSSSSIYLSRILAHLELLSFLSISSSYCCCFLFLRGGIDLIYINLFIQTLNTQFEQMKNQSRAIPFIIKKSEDSSYSLTPQAQQFLQNIREPLSIVSVAGLYRTGKSYLMNRVILNRSSGFGVGPTVNPCTKGLWIWAEPIKTHDNKTVLVIDTEGLGALDEESNHDMKIFCLAVLLSSTFIYNSVGNIDETALQSLNLVLNLVNTIDVQNYSSRPSLIWVVRDFSLQLLNQKDQHITSKEYLEMALKCQNLGENQKITLRNNIKNAFTERDCFTLVKPVIDEKKLQNLDNTPEQQLRPQFVSQTISLRKKIFESLKQIQINKGGKLAGNDYVMMIKQYLKAMNQGKMPNISDTWTYIKEQKSYQIFEMLKESHTEKIKNKLGSKIPIHGQKLAEILKIYQQDLIKQFIGKSYEEQPSEQLLAYLKNIEIQILRINVRQNRNAISENLKKQYEPYFKKLMNNLYSDHGAFEAELRNNFKEMFLEKFSDRFDIQQYQLEHFIEKKINESFKISFMKKYKEEIEHHKKMKNEIEDNLHKQIKKISELSHQDHVSLRQDIKSHERKLFEVNQDKNNLEKELIKFRSNQEHISSNNKRAYDDLNKLNQRLQKKHQQYQKLAAEKAEKQRQNLLLRNDIQKQKDLSKRRQDHLGSKVNQMTEKNMILQQQLKSIALSLETKNRNLADTSEKKLQDAMKEIRQMSLQVKDLKIFSKNETQEKEKLRNQIQVIKRQNQDKICNLKEKLLSSNRKQKKINEIEQQIRQMNEIREENIQLIEKCKESEQKSRHILQQNKILKINHQNQIAIHKQNFEFQKIEYNEVKNKYTEVDKKYQKMLCNEQSISKKTQQEYSFKIQKINEGHLHQLKTIEQQSEQKLNNLRRQLVSLRQIKEEIQSKQQAELQARKNKQMQYKEIIEQLEQSGRRKDGTISILEKESGGMSKQKQNHYLLLNNQLENTIQELKKKSNIQIRQLQKKSQDAIREIRSLGELEKIQFEKKHEDEKVKNTKRVKQTVEQYQAKLNEEKEVYENNIQDLQQKIDSLQKYYAELKQDCDIKVQKVNNKAIEERMEFSKRNALYEQELDLCKANYHKQIQTRKKQYQSYLGKQRDQLMADNSENLMRKNQELKFIQEKHDSLVKVNKRLEETNLILKAEMDKDKETYREKQINQRRNIQKMEERFNSDLIKQTKQYEESVTQKEKQIQSLNKGIEKINHQRCVLEDEKNKIRHERDSEKNMFEGKKAYYESKIKKHKEEYEDLLQKFEITVKSLSQNASSNKSQYKKSTEEIYKKVQVQFKSKLSEKQNEYQNEVSHYTGKINKLQQQNKLNRDKIQTLELKLSTQNRNRGEFSRQQIQQIKEQYEFKLKQLRNVIKKLEEQMRYSQKSPILDKSRNLDKSERHSFISEYSNDGIARRPLQEAKNVSNMNSFYGSNSQIHNQSSISVSKKNMDKPLKVSNMRPYK